MNINKQKKSLNISQLRPEDSSQLLFFCHLEKLSQTRSNRILIEAASATPGSQVMNQQS